MTSEGWQKDKGYISVTELNDRCHCIIYSAKLLFLSSASESKRTDNVNKT